MDANAETEKETVNTLPQEEIKQYKIDMFSQHNDLLNEVFTADTIRKVLNEQPITEDGHGKSLNSRLAELITILIGLISGVKQNTSNKIRRVDTNYRFCSKQLRVTADLEALMQVLGIIDLREQTELFRQSASAAEVKTLCTNLQNTTFPRLSPDTNLCPEEKERRNRELVRIITYNFKEFEIETVAAVYKIVLKTKNPLFPVKYISEYIKIGKITEKEKKITLCKFVLLFLVSPAKRELLEITSNFLYSMITKENSPLRFENISVVFAPIFFIDDGCSIVNETFKEVMERLKDFLVFFLENSKEIFLV